MRDEFAGLAARHLRRQRALLALWRHTLRAPILGSPEWDDWLGVREHLIGEFISRETARAAATTTGPVAAPPAATAALLQQMREGEVRMAGAVAHLEALLLAVGERRLRVAARALRRAAESRAACRSYDAAGRATRRHSQRG